jgi:hypothetical protein
MVGLIFFLVVIILLLLLFIGFAASNREPWLVVPLAVFAVLLGVLIGVTGSSAEHAVLSGQDMAGLQVQTFTLGPGQQQVIHATRGFYWISADRQGEVSVCDGTGCSDVAIGPSSNYTFQVYQDDNQIVTIAPYATTTFTLKY